MVGKLARWLRILGFDVAYFSRIEDEDLIRLAARERRIILTRDHELIKKALKKKSLKQKALLIESENWEEQVDQVLDHFRLRKKIDPNSRCLECNEKLKFLPRNRAKNLVPPFVYEKVDAFAICPACGRVFWKGTHFRDMEKKLARFTKRNTDIFS